MRTAHLAVKRIGSFGFILLLVAGKIVPAEFKNIVFAKPGSSFATLSSTVRILIFTQTAAGNMRVLPIAAPSPGSIDFPHQKPLTQLRIRAEGLWPQIMRSKFAVIRCGSLTRRGRLMFLHIMSSC